MQWFTFSEEKPASDLNGEFSNRTPSGRRRPSCEDDQRQPAVTQHRRRRSDESDEISVSTGRRPSGDSGIGYSRRPSADSEYQRRPSEAEALMRRPSDAESLFRRPSLPFFDMKRRGSQDKDTEALANMRPGAQKGSKTTQLVYTGDIYQVITPTSVKDRHVILFDDLLIVSKSMSEGDTPNCSLQVKHIIPLSTILFQSYPRPCVYDSPDHPVIQGAIKKFVVDPVVAIDKLTTKNLIPGTPSAIAHLLHSLPLHSRALGQYLIEPENEEVLEAYVRLLPIYGLPLDIAMRLFLGGIRLPGDADTIDHIIGKFVETWWDVNSGLINPLRSVGVNELEEAKKLGFGILGLNADLWAEDGSEGGHATVAEDELVEGFKSVSTVFAEHELTNLQDQSGVSEIMLRQIYRATAQEKIEMSDPAPIENTIPIQVMFQTARAPYVVHLNESSSLTLEIPNPDPNLVVELFAADIQFRPSVVNFGQQASVTVDMSGTKVGRALIFLRVRNNAKYHFETFHMQRTSPACFSVNVEHGFMRHAIGINCFEAQQMARRDRREKKYVFAPKDGDMLTSLLREYVDRAKYGTIKVERMQKLSETMLGKTMEMDEIVDHILKI